MNHYDTKFTSGLSNEQVRARKEQGLSNVSGGRLTKSVSRIIFSHLFTFFNLFNLAVGACVAIVGEYKNLLFLMVVFVNTLIGIAQEIRSKRMVDRLSVMTLPKAAVVRDGVESEIHFEELVLDDVIKLCAGRQVGADSVVLDGSVEVNEALLTGEADAILKNIGDELLSGSFIVSGTCYARVERVGADNYAEKLAREAKAHKRFHSKLLDSLNRIIRFTSCFVVPIGLLIFMTRSGEVSVNAGILAAAAAVIGMLPNGLMLLTSVSLSVGVVKLGRSGALVQRLFGIEALSRVDVLCLDKTGTLTQGRMRVERVVPLGSELPVPLDAAMSAFVSAMDDNNATFLAVKEYFTGNANNIMHCDYEVQKDDNASIKSITNEANETNEVNEALSILKRIPFSSERKYSAAVFRDFTLIVGAPDVLMERVPQEIAELERDARVLLVAIGGREWSGAASVTPVAAVVLEDEIRPDAKRTLEYFASQGVALKIISGDNPATVSGVAKRAGFADYETFVDAKTLDAQDIPDAAESYSIFGRVKPEQKRAIIQALQQNGHTVAMVGDGVNDVLALREADCGVAMAAGSEAARQVAQIVLLDSDFAVLPGVVNEGRRVVNNITRTASLFLLKTGYSFLLSLASLVFAFRYPFIPIQLTLIGMFIQGIPSFFLALEPNSERIKDDFFGTVLSNFLPSSLIVALNVAFIRFIAPGFGMSEGAISTLCVLSTGAAGLFLLLRVSLPLGRMRAMLLALMTAGFFFAALVFPGLSFFSLGTLNATELAVLLGIIAVCYPLTSAISRVVRALRISFNRHTPL